MFLAIFFLIFLIGCNSKHIDIFVGSCTKSSIYLLELDGTSGITYKSEFNIGTGRNNVDNVTTPSWMHSLNEPNKDILIVTNELSGHIASFKIKPLPNKKSALIPIDKKPTSGREPTYVVLDKQNKFSLVANYQDGNVEVIKQKEGIFIQRTSFVQHSGNGPDKDRQTGPHAHQIIFGRTEEYVYSCDLGSDKIYQYKFDHENGRLNPLSPPYFEAKPGDGPRHMAFHPKLHHRAYSVSELSNELIVLNVNTFNGQLSEFKRHNTLPIIEKSLGAEIVIEPTGKFIFVSNRLEDKFGIITMYRVKEDGDLELVMYQNSFGKHPRGMIYIEEDNQLLVLNQKSNSIALFKINMKLPKLEMRTLYNTFLEGPCSAIIYEHN